MKVYTVRWSANQSWFNCDNPAGYKWGYEVFDSDDRWCGSMNTPGHIPILERWVRADTGSEALRKFSEWHRTGKPEKWLME